MRPALELRHRNRYAGFSLILLLPVLLAGCYVKVDKGKNGEDKDVEVRMPIGGVQVHQSAPSPEEMGLPNYPGATIVEDKDGNSADVHVGFGHWQMTLRVAKYQTGDSQEKVASFYRTALGRYGEVLTCQDGHAVGSLTVTREGLGCNDKHPESKGVHLGDDDSGYALRAGSKRHQHIVAIRTEGSSTRFTLLRLDLPADSEESGQED
jgi:hypothetical protein